MTIQNLSDSFEGLESNLSINQGSVMKMYSSEAVVAQVFSC